MSTSRDRVCPPPGSPGSPGSETTAAAGPAAEPLRDARYPAPPWNRERGEGPAYVSVHDLAAWALAIAERDIADWPAGRCHVRSARRFVRARLRGRRARDTAAEDLEFTAALLARIFDDELHLSATDVIAVLDALGLPTEVVPIVPQRRSPVRVVRPVPTPPAGPAAQVAPAAHPMPDTSDAPPMPDFLSTDHRFRNAA